jgi:uncharacterized membrane protein
MTAYSSTLFLHLASVLLLFIGFGIEWAANHFLRASTAPDEARTWLRLARLGPLLSGPALLALILSGGYLAYVTGLMKQGWIPASFLGILCVFLPGVVIHVPRMAAIRNALSMKPAALAPELVAKLRDPLLATSVRTRALLALGIVYLMTAKLSLELSLLALLAFTVLGLLLSLRFWLGKHKPSS